MKYHCKDCILTPVCEESCDIFDMDEHCDFRDGKCPDCENDRFKIANGITYKGQQLPPFYLRCTNCNSHFVFTRSAKGGIFLYKVQRLGKKGVYNIYHDAYGRKVSKKFDFSLRAYKKDKLLNMLKKRHGGKKVSF